MAFLHSAFVDLVILKATTLERSAVVEVLPDESGGSASPVQASAKADETGVSASPEIASAKAGDFFDHIYHPIILMTV